MRRWVVMLVMVVGVFASSSVLARKKIMIMDPPLVRSCPRPKSLSDLTDCLAKHGWGSRVERTVGNTKILRLDTKTGSRRVDTMLALYVEDPKGLHLGGMYSLPGDDPASRTFILAARSETVKGHTGTRVDLGEERPSTVSFDDATSRVAVELVRHSLYCSGVSWECVDVITSCDVLVQGKAYWTFRGSVSIKDDMIEIAGDRTVAGSCAPPARQFLGWPTT